MSYCRPGPEKSLYVYASVDSEDEQIFICHGCPNLKRLPWAHHGMWTTKRREAMLEHIKAHNQAGWSSGDAVARLEQEIKEEGRMQRTQAIIIGGGKRRDDRDV